MQKKILYAGLDESNHGVYPEIFALTFSEYKPGIEKSQNKLPKNRNKKALQKVIQEYNNDPVKDYRFTFTSEEDQSRHNGDHLGVVIASLFDGIIKEGFPYRLVLMIDGKFKRYIINNTRERLNDKFPFLKNNKIELACKPHGDQFVPLINDADSIAYYYSKSSIESKLEDERYLPFLG